MSNTQTVRKIAFITGTRAEYGLLRPLLQKAFADPDLCCSLLVTGTHLREEYGNTVQEIENDGLPIAERFDILRFGNAPADITQSVGLAVRLFGAWFAANPQDACVVLGDRYEIFAAASAAALQHIPVVHISGGDITYGAQDDWFRHCLTKMSALHFPYCEDYRRRLLRMGEEPRRVFDVGGLGAESIHSLRLLTKKELTARFGFVFSRPYLLVTYHPETLSPLPAHHQLQQLLEALAALPDMGLCITGANADVGGDRINALWRSFVNGRANAKLLVSMGQLGYLSAMKHCAAVVGNSSSGVVETPEFGVPCVNIGQRQAGRLRCGNVLDCDCEKEAITQALQQALQPDFVKKARRTKSPFYKEDTSGNMLRILKESLENGLLATPKRFYDGEDTTV